MARKARTPSGDLWRVRRLVLPDALRPFDVSEAFSRSWVVRGNESFVTVGVQHGVPPGNVQMFGSESLAGLLVSIVLLLLLPLLLPIAFVCRLLPGRPCWVEAKRGGLIMRWRARGWSEAGRVADEVAEALEAGVRDPSPRGSERVYYWGPPDRPEVQPRRAQPPNGAS